MSLVNDIIPGIDNFLPLLNPALWLYIPNMKCNFKCAYCYVDRALNPRGTDDHPYNFKFPENIKELKGWIILYGGEPLTDKKLLYRLILAIRRFTGEPIAIPTNGSLLSYKDVNFFKTYNVKLSISYDGEYQKYRGLDIFKDKRCSRVLYKAYKKGVIYGLNTVIHSKNFFNYKFDIPKFNVIHDYNYIYPIETGANKNFLLDASKADAVANTVALNMKSLLTDLNAMSVKRLVLKYPPYLFTLLDSMLSLYCQKTVTPMDPNVPLCVQTNCVKLDIYGNKTCGKGRETKADRSTPLGIECATCRYMPICSFKCPANKFDRSLCKESYAYKIYNKVDILLQSALRNNFSQLSE